LVQWLKSPSWRGGAQRRPLIYLFATGFLVGKKKESRKIFNFANTFLRKTSLAIFLSRFAGHFAQTRKNF